MVERKRAAREETEVQRMAECLKDAEDAIELAVGYGWLSYHVGTPKSPDNIARIAVAFFNLRTRDLYKI